MKPKFNHNSSEELELKNSIESIDKRLKSLIEVQTKSTATSCPSKELES